MAADPPTPARARAARSGANGPALASRPAAAMPGPASRYAPARIAPRRASDSVPATADGPTDIPDKEDWP